MLSPRDAERPRGAPRRPRGAPRRPRRPLPSRATGLALLLAALLTAPPAVAAPAKATPAAPAVAAPLEALLEPVRRTASAGDELMGQLAPDGRTLYYLSNARATWQVYVQDLERGAPRPLFELDADAGAPRLSPDGSRLLFLSYERDATGDLCLLDLAGGKRRCLTDAKSAEAEAFWFPDGERVGVVSRKALHADYQLQSLSLRDGRPAQLLDRNLASPAVSPDGRWLIYVPLDRNAREVGVTFAGRAGTALELVRLAPSDWPTPPLPVTFALSGVSGFPAFSPDGRYLYFSRYLNDTNLDGRIDGDDHSVLFRVPFRGDADNPIDPTAAEQLTSARSNCRYPMPAASRLIATCAEAGSLDVYSLPLEGLIPSAWDRARLEEELHASRDPWRRLLVLSHLLRREDRPEARLPRLEQIIALHLELREFESADFYTRTLRDLGRTLGRVAVQSRAEIQLELIAARREEQQLSQGQLSPDFVYEQRARIEGLARFTTAADADTAAAALLTIAELHDVIGEKGRALAALERVRPELLREPWVLEAFGLRATDFYRQLQRLDAELEVYRMLASHPALETRERLVQAARLVRALVGSRPRAERPALLEAWLKKAGPGSELALVLETELHLARLTPDNQEAVRASLFDLYRDNKDFDRRRALVLTIVREAAGADNDHLLYEFSNSWVSWLKRAHAERRYAEALYRQVLLERAYIALAAANVSDARGWFYGLTLQSDALEAHAGFIEARIREGKDDLATLYATRFKGEPAHPVHRWVQAYLLARALPPLDDEAHARAVSSALDHLRAAAEAMPRTLEVHHLWGYVAHQRFQRTGEAEAAEEANTHYLLALNLARENPRFQAPLLLALGLLQAEVGSHRVALDYFARREELPQPRPDERLCLRLARARSLFHIGHHEEARRQATAALELIAADPGLERFRPLALERAALYAFTAGNYEQALNYYEALAASMPAPATPEARRRVIKVQLGRALVAQRLYQHETALEALEQVQRRLESDEPTWPEPGGKQVGADRYVFGREEYLLLVSGLRAHSHRALGQLDEAARSMESRLRLLEARFEASDLDEDLLELAIVRHHLADYAWTAGRAREAATHAARGLEHTKAYGARTGSPMTPVGLQLLRDYAQALLYGKVPPVEGAPDLKTELEATYRFLCSNRLPGWEKERFLFPLYLTLLELAERDRPARAGE